MSSSAPAVASSGAGEGDTTLALATMVPYSSDGPTLPLIGGASEHSGTGAGKGSASRAAVSSGNRNTQASHGGESRAKNNTKSSKSGVSKNTSAPSKPTPKSTIDLTPLYNPWSLLPPEILRTVETRCGCAQWWESHCISVVFTRNQNIRSGINRLKSYLGYERNADMAEELLESLGKEEVVVAVSAQGDATTKLVGIVEMVRRVVGEETQGDQSGGGRRRKGDGDTETWYLYTSLSSRVVERVDKGGGTENGRDGREGGIGGEANHEDFDMKDADDDPQQDESRTKKTPVLTAWMSKRRIPEFKKAFGEQTFEVRKSPEEA
jgi:hypothetical protein